MEVCKQSAACFYHVPRLFDAHFVLKLCKMQTEGDLYSLSRAELNGSEERANVNVYTCLPLH